MNAEKNLTIRRKLLDLSWIPCAVAVVVAIIAPFIWPGMGPIPAFMVMYVFVLMRGIGRYGLKNMLIFFAVYFCISMFMENLSTITGFPFGLYSYTLDTKIVNVPFGVGLFYLNIGFLSWTIASILLDGADRKLDNRINLFALPFVASIVMTVLDLATDSNSSTIQQMWIWPNGGGFFGVPFTNFLGWTFVTWICAQVFAFVLLKGKKGDILPASRRDFVWPTLAYGAMGLNLMITFFTPTSVTSVTDAAGKIWYVSDIREMALLVAFYTMVFLAAFALFKLGRGDFSELGRGNATSQETEPPVAGDIERR